MNIQNCPKTLKDLEFDSITKQLSTLCNTELGKSKAINLAPYPTSGRIVYELNLVSEYKSSFIQDQRIPNHGFDSISEELRMLKIEDSFLEANHFRKIIRLCETTHTQLIFFKKQKELYPTLFDKSTRYPIHSELVKTIDQIVDKYGEIRNNASPVLQNLRREIQFIQSKASESFVRALGSCNSYGYLDEIKETIIDNKRVLAVKAMYRKKVKGSILGSSKTGSIVYIQPEATLQFSRMLENLLYEEKEEIIRILRKLTEQTRPYANDLDDYQDYLSDIDVISAKVKHAKNINANLPQISQNGKRELFLKDAYHPLLLSNHNAQGKKTYPQTLTFNEQNRIIVISGPNAGGKSITLKTIGLLQLMLQSGMLVPVHAYSKMCFFEHILSDIGDNQSIENELSTYSYRLQNMKRFLKQCNEHTLFLIDEFGTGSDPELGGALAESFLEEFYERKAYGIITTHYANLKKMASDFTELSNANMLFDIKALVPRFQLKLGQAGSSFTFEVAQQNGIPLHLINKAKRKINRGKVKYDETLAKLQQQQTDLSKNQETLVTETSQVKELREKLNNTQQKLQQKLEGYQELYDHNQKLIALGKKFETIVIQQQKQSNKKKGIDAFLKILAIEVDKINKSKDKQKQKQKEALEREALRKIEEVRKQKAKEARKVAKQEAIQKTIVLHVGDEVRLKDGKAKGIIDTIEKGKAHVNYGMFITKVNLDDLELVNKKKR